MQLHHKKQRRGQTRGQLERRYALIAGAAMAAVLCAAIGSLVAGKSAFDSAPIRSTDAGDVSRTGTIRNAATGSCRSFDNDTGRSLVADDACDRKSEDRVHGSAGRIDAIRKSFSGSE
jgi:hypothetical protein